MTPVELLAQCCLPPSWRRRPPRMVLGARSRGPHARCLRFTAAVTRVAARLASRCPVWALSGWRPASRGSGW